jgi:F0F1-type ATP synthase epsilon subunit
MDSVTVMGAYHHFWKEEAELVVIPTEEGIAGMLRTQKGQIPLSFSLPISFQ